MPTDQESAAYEQAAEPSAKAASILVDLLGVDGFADDAVAKISERAPLAGVEREYARLGALQAATIICDLLREFSKREEVDHG